MSRDRRLWIWCLPRAVVLVLLPLVGSCSQPDPSGKYVSERNPKHYLELVAKGKPVSGKHGRVVVGQYHLVDDGRREGGVRIQNSQFDVEGDILTLLNTEPPFTGRLRGNTITDDVGARWVKQ